MAVTRWRLLGILAVVGAVTTGSFLVIRDQAAQAERELFHEELASFEDPIEACDQEPDCISEALKQFVDERSAEADAILARQTEIEAHLRSHDAFLAANDRYLQCMSSGGVSIPADLDALVFDSFVTFGNEPADTSEMYKRIEPFLDQERFNVGRDMVTGGESPSSQTSLYAEERVVLGAVRELNADCQVESGIQRLILVVMEEMGILLEN